MKLCWHITAIKPFVCLMCFHTAGVRKMATYTMEQWIFIIKEYNQSSGSPKKGQKSIPSKVSCQSWTRQAHNIKPHQEISHDRVSVQQPLSMWQALHSKDWTKHWKSSRYISKKSEKNYQESAHPYHTGSIFCLLNQNFCENVIALDYQKQYRYRINWLAPVFMQPQSFGFFFFLWRHLKNKVYQGNAKTLKEPKSSIKHEILVIPIDVLYKVVSNFGIRLCKTVKFEGKCTEHVVI